MQQREIEKFEQLAHAWRDKNGLFKHVIAFNQCRFKTIVKQLQQYFFTEQNLEKWQQLTLLDVGCGAGILTEQFARLGIQARGIDASRNNIEIAQFHAKQAKLNIHYQQSTFQQLEHEHQQYDIVLNTEVIEHVEDQSHLIEICCNKLKPGGLLVVATLNRTIKSYVIGILGAEYILRMLPIGTHNWNYFVKPNEIIAIAANSNMKHIHTQGMQFNPITKQWYTSSNTSVNYLQLLYKLGQVNE